MLRILTRRRRAAGLAAAAAGGCLALAACGPVQMGAAAIVGGQRITVSTLSSQVSQLQSYERANNIHLAFPASQATQQVLAWLIRFAVRDQLASRAGITVTPGDTQRAINALTAEERQAGNTVSLTALAVANGIPPDLAGSALGRYEAIESALVARLGGSSSSSTAQQQTLSNEFNRQQCLAAKSLDIKINPQFGRLDYSQLDIVATANTLAAPEPGASPTPSPSASPQFTPPC